MALVHVLDIAQDVGQICKKCPNGTLQRAIIRSARKFLRESRWYQTAIPGATAAGTRAYSLGSDPYEEIIAIRAMSITQTNGTVLPVVDSDPSGWNPNGSEGLPRRYAYLPEGQFALDNVPDATYSLLVTVALIPKAGQVHIEERVLSKWDQVIQAGALDYLLRLKEPWQDINEANAQLRRYQAGISNAKADEQRRFQQGSQRAVSRAIF